MLGVVAALPMEARCLAGARLAPGAFRGAGETLIYCSGPGEAPARRAAEHLIVQGAHALVSWGTAGALAPSVSPGDLVLAESVLTEEHPLAVEPHWHKRLSELLNGRVPIHRGKLLHTGHAVGRAEAKQALFEASGAIAVDMESAGIAMAASKREIPFLIVRAIVDAQARDLPRAALAALDATGRIRLGRMLPILLRDPREIAGLMQLALDFRTALATLKKVARLAGTRLAFR